MSVSDQESLDWRRSTKSKKERFENDFSLSLRLPTQRGENSSVEKETVIHQRGVNDINTLGMTIWDGSIVLSKYLEKLTNDDPSILHDKKVLELGSGTGLLGVATALLGGRVTFTDYECFDLLNCNVRDNISDQTRVAVKRLAWGEPFDASYLVSSGNVNDNQKEIINNQSSDPETLFDVIVAADLVYYPFLIEPLVKTLNVLCYGGSLSPPNPKVEEEDEAVAVQPQPIVEIKMPVTIPRVTVSSPLIYFCAENHNKYSIETFLELMRKTFDVEQIASSELDPYYQHEDIYVWRVKTRNVE